MNIAYLMINNIILYYVKLYQMVSNFNFICQIIIHMNINKLTKERRFFFEIKNSLKFAFKVCIIDKQGY